MTTSFADTVSASELPLYDRLAVTVKNTFIDLSPPAAAIRRIRSCSPTRSPSVLDRAFLTIAVLDLAVPDDAKILSSPRQVTGLDDADARSEISTSASDDQGSTPRSKSGSAVGSPSSARLSSPSECAFKEPGLLPSSAVAVSLSLAACIANTPSSGKKKGSSRSSKGLPFFSRIPVGLEDTKEFKVLQRLIGPRGSFMRDICVKSGGAKVWIVGRGSRSWEDSEGPLQVCVGATGQMCYNGAVAMVNNLISRVRAERAHLMNRT